MNDAPESVVQAALRSRPLLRFSAYTAIQADIVRNLSAEIRSVLDDAFRVSGQVQGDSFSRAYGLFWLWVLGSYEVVRTMSSAPTCFTASAFVKIRAYKKRIAVLRIPFAKQQYRGEATAIRAEASVWGIDQDAKDLKFEVKDRVITIRTMLDDFDELITALTPDDVLSDLRDI